MKVNRISSLLLLRSGHLFMFILFFPFYLYSQWEIKWDSIAIKNKQSYLSSIPKNVTGKPNVILIVADDLGKYDLSVYGNLLIKTPNIDRLATEGAICTQGYATAPICSPSRAGMLTGRYQQRFGYQFQPQQRYPRSRFEWWAFCNMNTSDLEPGPYGIYPTLKDIHRQGLPPSEITIAEMLKASGYITAWIGKWHLGYDEPLLPKNFGFDYQYGCYEAFTLFADPKDKNIVNARIDEFTDKHIWKKGRKDACAIIRNGEVIDEKQYLTYAFGREANQFISINKSNPFFLYLPITAPHTPYQAPKEIYDSLSFIQDHNKRVYYSMIIAMDKMVGDLVEHLKKESLLNNTMIIFTSDNGAALYSNTVTNEPLIGGKFTFYEGGINVPLIFNYPGKIKPKTTLTEPVMLFDIYATIADMVELPLLVDRKMDGKSLIPQLFNRSTNKVHNELIWYNEYNQAMRIGNWKLIVNRLDNTMELYDLSNMNQELIEMSTEHQVITTLMLKYFNEWIKEIPPALWPRLVDYQLKVNGKVTKWAI